MANIEKLLSGLQKVKKTGANRWLACCPAHEDNSPSLSIMQNETGKIFVHCFAQCDGRAIMAAIGMRVSDLYPDRIDPPHGTGKRPPYNPYDVLQAIAGETQIVALVGSELTKHPLSNKDRERLFKAVSRINAAHKLIGVRYGV